MSHSKKDKFFIERLANDLKTCGIDVWYDDWEIPPGESIRKKIFEDGLPSCDVFFIYLTPNSISSYWVQKELDSAFIHEIDKKNNFLMLFVDEDSSREQLSVDLRSLNIPRLNSTDYAIPFGKLISKTWMVHHKNQLKNFDRDAKIKSLELEKEISELQKRILQIQQSTVIDIDSIMTKLKKVKFEFRGTKINLLDILKENKYLLADGCNAYQLTNRIQNLFETEDFVGTIEDELKQKYKVPDYTGELIILGLIETRTTNEMDQYYFLTKEGIQFIKMIE